MEEQDQMIHINEVPTSELYSHAQAKAYLSRVYMWMAVSMAITAGVAIYSAHNPDLLFWTLEHPLLLCLSTLGIVLVMYFFSGMLTAGALGVLLMVYAGVTGMLFGPLLFVYTQHSLGITFACTASTFGVMSLYGIFTKRDLHPWGRALFMGLIGLIIALIINLIWGNSTFDIVISGAGVLIFTLLTAYDTQKLLREGLYMTGSSRSKGAVLGALSLYLDFINLFLYLLRFLGDRR